MISVIAVLFMVILFRSYVGQFFRWEEVAYGCDAYGYIRQAALFRENGFFNGLDTSYISEPNEVIVNIALSSGLPSSVWGQAVAPHCHHFDVSTQKIILQYPPLTGLMLAFFNEAHQVRALLAAVALLVGILISSFLIGRKDVFGVSLCVMLYTAILNSLERGGAASYSIVATLLLIVPVSFLLARYVTLDNTSKKMMIVFLGIGFGLSISARTANILLLAGVIPLLFYRFFQVKSLQNLWNILLYGCSFLLGSVPLLLFNSINAGSPFSTTYDVNDSDRGGLTVNLAVENFQFYFFGSESIPNLACFVMILLMIFLLRHRREKLIPYVLVSIPLFAIAAVFFITHPVRTTYYLLPSNVFIWCFSIAYWCWSSPADQRHSYSKRRSLFGGGIFALSSIFILYLLPISVHLNKFDEARAYGFTKSSFLWADIWGGAASYYGGIPTAKMVFLWESDSLNHPWVSGLRKNGFDQYFMWDTDNAGKMILKLASSFCLIEIPAYRSNRMFLVPAKPSERFRESACMNGLVAPE